MAAGCHGRSCQRPDAALLRRVLEWQVGFHRGSQCQCRLFGFVRVQRPVVRPCPAAAAAAQQQQPADNTNADSSNNDTSDSTECEEDSADTSDNASSGAAAAAASGSKSNAAKGNGGGSSSSSSSNSSSNSSSSSNSGSSSSSSSSSSESTSGSFDGQATYYAPGLGACGWTNTESDYIVAVSHSLFDSFGTGNPNKNPICGHKIKATYQGKSITVSVSDRCEGCAWGDLDFTPSGFQQLAPLSKGRLDGLTWSWIGAAP